MDPTEQPSRVVVVGAGGMGRCILDLVDAINAAGGPRCDVVGVVDDGQPDTSLLTQRQVSFLGGVAALRNQPPDVGFVIGIAATAVRAELDAALRNQGRLPRTLIHPNVHLGYGAVVGSGSVLCSHVSVENNVTMGRHVHVNQNSTIGHDTVLGDYVTVSPLVAVSGAVHAETRVFLGTGSCIRQGVRLNAGAVVGMGAAVISDVASGDTVVGVPARSRH